MNCVPEPSMYRPEKIRMGVDVVLHPGFSFSSDPGHSRPTLSRQRSRITKVYVHFMCCSPIYVCATQKKYLDIRDQICMYTYIQCTCMDGATYQEIFRHSRKNSIPDNTKYANTLHYSDI